MYKSENLLIISSVGVEPNSSAAGMRTLKLIEFFKALNWQITFATTAVDSGFEFDLTQLAITRVKIELNNVSFDSFIKKLNPSIVIFDRFMIEEQFAWRVAEICPDALRILDTVDLHCLRQARLEAFKNNKTFEIKNLNSDLAKREIASILRSDLTLVISEFEIKLLKTHFKIDANLLFYLPLIVDGCHPAVLDNYQYRSNFIFIGNFIHQPNFDAVLYLKKVIWDKIRKKLPKVELNIYGAYPSKKVLDLADSSVGFNILGRAENTSEVFINSRVCLAPLRFGAGIKGKLIDSMVYGTPSVSSTIASEGINADLDWSGFISDDPDDFSEHAVTLYSNQTVWQNAQLNGFKIIQTRFLKDLFEDLFFKKIINIKNNLEQHRNLNFFGKILLYNLNQSTKYMSKWIEEKNTKLKSK